MERESRALTMSLMLRALVAAGVFAVLTGWWIVTRASPDRALGFASVSLAQDMVGAVPLDPNAIVIGEETFDALMARGGGATPLPVRDDAAAVAANLADPAALGVIATLQRRPSRIRSDLFVVLRDPALSRHGELEGRDAFVAAVELSGKVPWFGHASRVALLSDRVGGGGRGVPQGCRPIFDARSRGATPLQFSSSRSDTAGLPSTVLLNLESGAGPPNASGHRPSLLVFGTEHGQRPNAYECHAPVGWSHASAKPRLERGKAVKPVGRAALPRNTILLSERDFLTALSQGNSAPVRGRDAPVTRRLLALANSDEALGIFARYNEDKRFSGELFAVARDPMFMPDGRVRATEYYLVPVKLSGTASWQGRLPEIGFEGEIPNVRGDFCGLVSTPMEVPPCDRPPCESLESLPRRQRCKFGRANALLPRRGARRILGRGWRASVRRGHLAGGAPRHAPGPRVRGRAAGSTRPERHRLLRPLASARARSQHGRRQQRRRALQRGRRRRRCSHRRGRRVRQPLRMTSKRRKPWTWDSSRSRARWFAGACALLLFSALPGPASGEVGTVSRCPLPFGAAGFSVNSPGPSPTLSLSRSTSG